MQYRRAKTPGGTCFFTVVTYRRRKFLTQPDNVALLREAFREVMERHPAQVDTKAQQLHVTLVPFARITINKSALKRTLLLQVMMLLSITNFRLDA